MPGTWFLQSVLTSHFGKCNVSKYENDWFLTVLDFYSQPWQVILANAMRVNMKMTDF